MEKEISVDGKKPPEQPTEQPTLVEYLAGAGVANIPVFILAFMFSYVDAEISAVQRSFILLFLIFVGTAFAGFLVGRKVAKSYVRVGAITGALSFLVYCVFILFFFYSTAWSIWLFLDFFLGGCTGGKLRELKEKR